MDKKEIIAKRLKDILPERTETLSAEASLEKSVDATAERIIARQTASELARIKYKERSKLARKEARYKKDQADRAELAKSLGLESPDELPPEAASARQAEELYRQRKKVEALETIEAEAVEMPPVLSTPTGDIVPVAGTTRKGMAQLLTALNVNLDIQLSKSDTANLLACLLTCNEAQLQALYVNKKVPVAIKTVIRRLQQDLKLGNIDTIERLWDRIFGKASMSLNLPQGQQLETGIIPNTPISREAYILIRDKMMK